MPLTLPVGIGSEFSGVVSTLDLPDDVPGGVGMDPAEVNQSLMDAIVEADEELMERYLEGEELSEAELSAGVSTAIASGTLIPIFCTSSKTEVGVDELLDALASCTLTPGDVSRSMNSGDEEVAVGAVVRGFRAAIPGAQIYVFDNASTDATALRATDAGAIVRYEPARGKGNVVRRMFADVEADIYVMADGDGTYDAALASALVERLYADSLDMVVGTRLDSHGQSLFRGGHRIGNQALSWFVGHLFHHRLADMLSSNVNFNKVALCPMIFQLEITNKYC